MSNPFYSDFEQLLHRLVELQNFLYLTKTLIEEETKKQSELLERGISLSDQKSFSRLVFRDITGKENTGRGTGKPTGIIKNLVWAQYQQELNKMMSKYTCNVLVQSCEALNKFLKDMYGIQLKHNQSHAESIDNTFLSFKTYDEYKDHVRLGRIDTRGETIFQSFDDTCPEFEHFHYNNHWGIDLTIRYQVLVKMRHAITHSSSRLDLKDIGDWKREHHQAFKNYCNVTRVGTELHIEMNYNHGHKSLKNTAELGFTIFKALSICNGYIWDIFDWEKE